MDARRQTTRPVRRVLIPGGYGSFGQWLVQTLARDARLEITVAGRNAEKAAAMCARVRQVNGARLLPACIDVGDDRLAEGLASRKIDLVIHAAGPFQARDYRVAAAAIESGSHYLDLSDARRFVTGISGLDKAAKAAGVEVISGASSVPGLSSVVVDHLAGGLARVDDIDIQIAPGNRAPRGEATIRAILGYTGKPFRVWRNGEWRQVFGWQELRRQRYQDIGWRWLAACDVPDLESLPARYPDVGSVRFSAGLELGSLHLAMWVMAGMVRSGLIRDWSAHTRWIGWLARRFEPLGSDTGAMRVRVAGVDRQGASTNLAWTLIAREGHGPRIPTIPALILARELIDGRPPAPGARPCVAQFGLAQFTRAVGHLSIEQHLTRATIDGEAPNPARV